MGGGGRWTRLIFASEPAGGFFPRRPAFATTLWRHLRLGPPPGWSASALSFSLSSSGGISFPFLFPPHFYFSSGIVKCKLFKQTADKYKYHHIRKFPSDALREEQ